MALPESELQKSVPRLTIEEYLDFEGKAEERHEYINGFIYAMAGESPEHGLICTNLVTLFVTQLKGRPCETYTKDTKVRSGPQPVAKGSKKGSFSYPDLVIVCGEKQFHDDHRHVLINPTLIVEVLSDSTEQFDWGAKFLRLRNWNPSLTDYLLVWQKEPVVDYFFKGSDGIWRLITLEGLAQTVEIASLGCRLPLVEIFDRVTFPPPDNETGEDSAADDQPT